MTEERTGSNPYVGTMVYDAVGNRTIFRDGTTVSTFSYDVADQLTTLVEGTATTTYAYDANGNLEVEHLPGGHRVTHTWDDENRLIQYVKGSTTNQYSFNADGQRVRIVDTQSPSGRRLIWDEENILLETTDAGSTEVVYTLEPAVSGNSLARGGVVPVATTCSTRWARPTGSWTPPAPRSRPATSTGPMVQSRQARESRSTRSGGSASRVLLRYRPDRTLRQSKDI